MSRPFKIDVSDWKPFDPSSATDAMCERERNAFTQYLMSRARKKPKTGSDDIAILVGALMSIVSLGFAMHGNTPSEQDREQLHNLLDHCWLLCETMIGVDEVKH